MAEQTLEQHQSLSGSGLATDPLFGAFQSLFGGIYNPAKSEQVGGNHYISIANKLYSIEKRYGSAFPGRTYKDSADANNRFSVKPFAHVERGIVCVYAGETALGPLVTGVNKIWADVTAAPTVTIAFGADWPTIAHVPLAEITMPASGHWLPAEEASMVSRVAVRSADTSGQFKKAFAFGDVGTINICKVPAGAHVIVHVAVDTPFNGSGQSLIVGDAGDTDRLFQAGDGSITAAGFNYAVRHAKYAAETQLTATLAGTGMSAGVGAILVRHW